MNELSQFSLRIKVLFVVASCALIATFAVSATWAVRARAAAGGSEKALQVAEAELAAVEAREREFENKVLDQRKQVRDRIRGLETAGKSRRELFEMIGWLKEKATAAQLDELVKLEQELKDESTAFRKEAKAILLEEVKRLGLTPRQYCRDNWEKKENPIYFDAVDIAVELDSEKGWYEFEDIQHLRAFKKVVQGKKGEEALSAIQAAQTDKHWWFCSKTTRQVMQEVERELRYNILLNTDRPQWERLGQEVEAVKPTCVLPHREMVKEKGKDVTYCVAVQKIAFSPDGKRLASNDRDRVWCWSLNGKKLWCTKIPTADIGCNVSFSPDGKLVAAGSWRGLTIFAADDGSVVGTYNDAANHVQWFADHLTIGGIGWESPLAVLHVPSNTFILKEKIKVYCPRTYELSLKDGKVSRLLMTGWAEMDLWEDGTIRHLKEEQIYRYHSSTSRALYNKGDEWIVTHYPSKKEISRFRRKADLGDTAFSGDGNRIATGNHDGTLKVHDAMTGKEVFSARYGRGLGVTYGFQRGSRIEGVALSHDGCIVAAGGTDSNSVKIWAIKK